MITEYLFLGPRGEVLCSAKEIRRYVEDHYEHSHPCSLCGCYLIPTRRTERFFFRTYRCANCICSASLSVFRIWPRARQAA